MALVALILFGACKKDDGGPEWSGNGPPPEDWSAPRSAQAFRDVQEESAEFVMWQIIEIPQNPLPVVAHEAIVCGRLDDNRYFLGHVWRHPNDVRAASWQPYKPLDAPMHVFLQEYNAPPNQRDLEVFLKASRWKTEYRAIAKGAANIRICAK